MAAMTDTKHTPTPWHFFADLDSVDLMTKHGLHIATLEPENAHANAVFIVHACNNIERVEAENAELRKRNDELAKAARNLLTYRYCLKDGAGRKETNAGIERACAALAKAQEGA